jgi:uncharacterized membrane protein
MWSRENLKNQAKSRFHYNYWKMVLVAFIATLAGSSIFSRFTLKFDSEVNLSKKYTVSSPLDIYRRFNYKIDLSHFIKTPTQITIIDIFLFLGIVLSLFLAMIMLNVFIQNPLYVGTTRFFIINSEKHADFSELGFSFGKHYKNIVKTMFFMSLKIFLWTLLFIIPGIIKAYEYRMVPFILAERPDLDTKEVLKLGSRMMEYEKFNVFILDLSFIGWGLLSAITFGIVGVFFVSPYIEQTYAALYNTLKCRIIEQLNYENSPNIFENK